MGERLAGYVYGTVVALSVIVAGARSFPHAPQHTAVLVAVTVATLWLAHVYAHALSASMANGGRISLAALRRIAHHEGSMIEAAVPLVLVLLLGSTELVSPHTAVWAAFGVGLGVLAAQGITLARVERLGPVATVAVVAANLGLGVLLIGLKLLVGH